MVFAFTFSVPTLPNPFAQPQAPEPYEEADMGGVHASSMDTDPRPRKRAWMPISASAPSLAVSSATSEPGYLDTPSKYLDAVACADGPGDDPDAEQGPPMKRRRTIADSIVSTALSAALIGAAVGIAAYRVWRDRGKGTAGEPDDKQAPPPPYSPRDWVSVQHDTAPVPQHHTLPKAARRSRRTHPAGSSSHRRKPSHLTVHHARHASPPPPSLSPRRAHFPSGAVSDAGSEPTEFDDHADWMGAQLSRLIAEGKRALGQDVVLPPAPDEPQDDGDDGDEQDAWEDEQPARPISAASSYRGRSHLRPASPFLNTPPRSPLAASSSSSAFLTPVSVREDDDALSPELREHMARVRSARRGHT